MYIKTVIDALLK